MAGSEMLGMSDTSNGECSACMKGAYRAAPAASATLEEQYAVCSLCNAGKFLDATGSNSESSCKPCAIGFFQETQGASTCNQCSADHFGQVRRDGTSHKPELEAEHCVSCGAWEPWSACTATCGDRGTRTRLRHKPADGGHVCEHEQTEPCNRVSCPQRNLCTYIKCRYQKNAADHFSVQVYHHRKEPNAVHHCRLYEGGEGSNVAPQCHCYCWDQGKAPALTGTKEWHMDDKLNQGVEEDMKTKAAANINQQ
jgi:hypothetical protein